MKATLSATNSALAVELQNLVLTFQNTSSTSVRISIVPKDTAAPILADVRRATIYNNGTAEAQTLNNTTISARTVIDDLMYSQSQETHNIKIRQQNPETKLWSLCEVDSFILAGGARTSVKVEWIEYEVEYSVPEMV